MQTEKVINKFRVWVDDASELSIEEELDLAHEKLDEILGERTWSFLKKTASVDIVNSEVILPEDFKYVIKVGLPEDYLYVKVGNVKVRIVALEDRFEWGTTTVAYIDYSESKIKFNQSISGIAEFDYIMESSELSMDSVVIGPRSMGYAVARLMARDFYTLDQTENGRSQYQSNEMAYQKLLDQMSVQDNYGFDSVE
tara:strand:- start:363 stop:953 length:591 start_codon:yes stop_codon:yes gene_type:complete